MTKIPTPQEINKMAEKVYPPINMTQISNGTDLSSENRLGYITGYTSCLPLVEKISVEFVIWREDLCERSFVQGEWKFRIMRAGSTWVTASELFQIFLNENK